MASRLLNSPHQMATVANAASSARRSSTRSSRTAVCLSAGIIFLLVSMSHLCVESFANNHHDGHGGPGAGMSANMPSPQAGDALCKLVHNRLASLAPQTVKIPVPAIFLVFVVIVSAAGAITSPTLA